jgi:hypothetical protein
MSYNINNVNELSIRTNNILVDGSLKKKIGGIWVEVGTGGGVVLPSYLKENEIEFNTAGKGLFSVIQMGIHL